MKVHGHCGGGEGVERGPGLGLLLVQVDFQL